MASKSFIDLSGLTHYDEKLNEKLDAKYVALAGTQTVTGAKTFSETLYLSKGGATIDGTQTIQLSGKMGGTDYWQIRAGATANDAGFMEIATGDNGNEPIYFRQRTTSGIARTLTLLDGSGSSTFPGTIAAARVNAPVSMYKLDAPATDNINNGIPIGFYSLIDASRSCKTAFLPAANITIEYTIDGGETWLDYGASDAQKQNLFAMTRSGSVLLGKGSSGGSAEMTTDCKLRITFNRTGRYVRVNTLYLYVSDVGHTMNVDLEAAPFSTPDTFSAIRSGVRVSGYSGPNVISFDSRSFGQANANQSSQIYAFRLTFYCTAIGTNKTYYPNVSDIRMYGDVAWNYDNQMMLTDHLYSWDYEKNATFPAKVSAVGLNVGTGAITIDKSNGSNPSTCGILIKGSGQNAAITVSDTALTKGTDPGGNRYMALAFCGKDIDAWTKRVGMVEYHIGAGNLSEIALMAFNCTSNTNNSSCAIKACVDGSGNAYTAAPTPDASDNSTKIATTAFVKAQGYLTSHQSLANYVTLDGNQTISGAKTFSAEIKTASANAIRIKNGDYGVILRNDGTAFYMLVTASGDADGTWTTARPLAMDLATGVCSINGRAKQDSNGREIATGYMWRGTYERIEGTSSAKKDLNDYKQAGFYNVKTLNTLNCPEGIGIDAVLLNYPWNQGSYLTQEITESAASADCRRWIRKLNGSTWSAWKEVAMDVGAITTSQIDTLFA